MSPAIIGKGRAGRLLRGTMLSAFVACGLACDKDEPFHVPATTGEIGPAGGELVAGDAALTVPAGALDEPITFSIARADGTAAIDDFVVVGPFLEIGPAGTVFEVPAAVRVPYDPGALPSGTEADRIVVLTADRLDGSFTALPTSVAAATSTASAEVAHLSLFVPAVVDPSSDFAPCPAHGDCDCSERAARPLEVTGTADLGRLVRALCIDLDGNLRATSFTATADPLVVDEVYDTRFDPVTLEQLEESLVDLDIGSPELCQPAEPSYLAGADGAHGWSVRFVERDDIRTGERWYEAFLSVDSASGSIAYSFNGHLNAESPYVDTNPFYDMGNTLAARVRPDGSASFYLHIFAEAHVDVILVDDLDAVLADPLSYTGADGFGIPDVRERFELWDDPAGARTDTYDFASLQLAEDPDQPRHDRLIVFGTGPSLVRGFEVDGGASFTELPDLGLDPFWSQFGWQNAGLQGGVLHLQSSVASFSNSVILELDPAAWAVRRRWELGCLGPPSHNGFQVLGGGLLLRFAFDGMVDDVSRVMFVRDGAVLAIGEVPFVTVRPTFLVHPDGTRLYTAHTRTGELTAIAVP